MSSRAWGIFPISSDRQWVLLSSTTSNIRHKSPIMIGHVRLQRTWGFFPGAQSADYSRWQKVLQRLSNSYSVNHSYPSQDSHNSEHISLQTDPERWWCSLLPAIPWFHVTLVPQLRVKQQLFLFFFQCIWIMTSQIWINKRLIKITFWLQYSVTHVIQLNS